MVQRQEKTVILLLLVNSGRPSANFSRQPIGWHFRALWADFATQTESEEFSLTNPLAQ
jgi:hypothetical protein